MEIVLGIFIGFFIACIGSEVAKQSNWDKWTLKEFKLKQLAELKEFMLYKAEKDAALKEAEKEEKE